MSFINSIVARAVWHVLLKPQLLAHHGCSIEELKISHKVEWTSNSCARWRIDWFGSSSTLHSSAAIASSVHTVRSLCGCVLSFSRVKVVRKRSTELIALMNDYVDRNIQNHYFQNKFAQFRSVVQASVYSCWYAKPYTNILTADKKKSSKPLKKNTRINNVTKLTLLFFSPPIINLFYSTANRAALRDRISVQKAAKMKTGHFMISICQISIRFFVFKNAWQKKLAFCQDRNLTRLHETEKARILSRLSCGDCLWRLRNVPDTIDSREHPVYFSITW